MTDVTEENFSIEFNEEQNFVEIKYQGINAALLLGLQSQMSALQTELDNALSGVDGQLGTLANDLNSLSSITAAQGNELVDEIALRLAGDTTLGEQGMATALELADAIEAETEARGAAILNEAEERGAAIAEASAIIMTDVTALAVTVSGLATDMGAAQASIIEVSEALSTETSARAAQYSALQADFGDTNAAVLEESVARADADSAMAAQITAITATSWRRSFRQPDEPTGDVDTGDVWWDTDDGNKLYRYESGAWVATDNIRIAQNTAAIVSEQVARTDADSAMASDITTLFAQSGSNSAAVATEASARIAADGSISAKYSVKVDVNGYVSGFGLISTANGAVPTSEFVVTADSFKIFNGASPVSPFFVTGGVVYMTNVKVGTLDALTSSMGNLSVDGALTMSATGVIKGGKSSFSDPTNGFWIGYDAGAYKFTFGNSTNSISWNGSAMTVNGQIIATSNMVANAVTYITENHYTFGDTSPYDSAWNGTYAPFHPSHTGHIVTVALGSEAGTKYISLDLFMVMKRDGGDDDNVVMSFVDFTGGFLNGYVGQEAYNFEIFSGWRLYFFKQVIQTTATGNKTYSVYARSRKDGSPYVSMIQLSAQVFKK